MLRPVPILISLGLVSLCPLPVQAQTPPAPTHKHYEKPAGYDQAPAPGMPLAPRLQNLGVHTF